MTKDKMKTTQELADALCAFEFEIDMLHQQAEQIEALKVSYTNELDELATRNYSLRKENESLKADAERLDWLSEMAHKRFGVSLTFGKYAEDGLVLEKGYRVTFLHTQGDIHQTLRAAIDAMKG